jgi:hypothetical protein
MIDDYQKPVPWRNNIAGVFIGGKPEIIDYEPTDDPWYDMREDIPDQDEPPTELIE